MSKKKDVLEEAQEPENQNIEESPSTPSDSTQAPELEVATPVAVESPSAPSSIAALLLKANPLLPPAFAEELDGYLANRGFTSMGQRKTFEDAGTSVEYLFTSTIRNALYDKALNLYAQASRIASLDTTSNDSLYGVPVSDIFPSGSESLASRIRSELGKQDIQNARDLSHRSAPPRIHQALLDAFRVNGFGFDGQYIISFWEEGN